MSDRPRGHRTSARVLDVSLHLLDRQIVDSEGRMVAKVDDVELTRGSDGVLYVTAFLCGQQALGERMGGRLGWWIAQMARRLSPQERPAPTRIDAALVTDYGSGITLGARHEDVYTPPLEQWVDAHVIGRIPGARHAGE